MAQHGPTIAGRPPLHSSEIVLPSRIGVKSDAQTNNIDDAGQFINRRSPFLKAAVCSTLTVLLIFLPAQEAGHAAERGKFDKTEVASEVALRKRMCFGWRSAVIESCRDFWKHPGE